MTRATRTALTLLLPLVSLGCCALAAEGVLRLLGFGRAVQFDYVRELGWVHRPNQVASTLGRPVRINSQGFRGGPVAVEKPANTFRIMLVGDSFTFGYGVDEDSTYGALLGKRVSAAVPCRSVEVINAGVNGYNTRQEADFLRLVGARYRPDLVVVGLTPNDVMGVEEARTLLRYPRLKSLVARSALYQFMAPRLKAVLLPRELREYDATMKGYLDPSLSLAGPRWDSLSAALVEIRELGDRSGFHPVVAVFPLHTQVPDGELGWLQLQLRALGERGILDVVDVLPDYRSAAQRGESLFLDEPTRHPNSLGHEIAAAALARDLVNRRLHRGCGSIPIRRAAE